MRQFRKRLLTLAGVSVWVLAVAGALTALSQYKNRPGPSAQAPARWPTDSIVRPQSGLPTLVLLAHPRCPCTRATLTELARLTTRLGPRVSTHVLFVRPEGTPEESWEHSDLWDQAKAIPGVEAIVDRGGIEARRFGSLTSGQALLYAADGTLQFAGGITVSRGHEGDSPGAERIFGLVTTGESELAAAPVFGCQLTDKKQGER